MDHFVTRELASLEAVGELFLSSDNAAIKYNTDD